MTRVRVAAALTALASACAVGQTQISVDHPLRTGENQQAAVRLNEAIYLAYGFGNTFLVTTSAGNVVIDTSSVVRAARAKELLQRESAPRDVRRADVSGVLDYHVRLVRKKLSG
jgi:hypothetical protein